MALLSVRAISDIDVVHIILLCSLFIPSVNIQTDVTRTQLLETQGQIRRWSYQ